MESTQGSPASTTQVQNVHRWYEPGVGRYTRPDPIGLQPGSEAINLYLYVFANPLRWFDHLGLEAVCCTEPPQQLIDRALDAADRAEQLIETGGYDVGPGAAPIASHYCGAGRFGVPGDPTTFFHPNGFNPLGPCEKECTRVHEASHADICRRFGQLWTDRLDAQDEALAYKIEAICLLIAANERAIDVDQEFPELRPIPTP